MIKGTAAEGIIGVHKKTPERLRKKVQEVKRCFTNVHNVIDRFHAQKLAYHAVQECRIKYRWEALDAENKGIKLAKKSRVIFRGEVLSNGDTLKQLLPKAGTYFSSIIGKVS
ncbi:transposase [Pedobacter gandavensis]|uniref:Transposase IS204/IS1001/IS1096/IS1165 DDE domain-containing protein n=1 Tax=Pedobacter gandavensis TaxID=2679963 RepID=A0ABR6F2V9_9SPHI|nr:transposase [Pedobacter gandavensis]MBB2151880.1 hypothetical protein [Pedobacter gandavensis]